MSTKKDVTRIHRDEHDPESNARRVKIIDTEIGIELDHKDGDSVTSHPEKLVVSALGISSDDEFVVPPLDCSSIKRVQLYAENNKGRDFVIEISPVDSGDIWFTHGTLTDMHNCTLILEVCARRIRVKQTKGASGDCNIHLVGQG